MFEISKRTLAMIDQSMENMGNGKVSEPVDLSTFRYYHGESSEIREVCGKNIKSETTKKGETKWF